MRRANWRIFLVLGLVAASTLFYSLQLLLFRRSDETFFYMLQDVAFVPLQVLLVTLVINEILTRREKIQLQHKMNMVIGTFFVEVGNDLLAMLAQLDLEPAQMSAHLQIRPDWSARDFADARRAIREHSFKIRGGSASFQQLKSLLIERRPALMRLLENPNLLEHDTFTDVLWAICHLTEELEYRLNLDELPDVDLTHLQGDAARAYREIVSEWLSYVHHMKNHYPYMFSLVLRTNPFDAEAKVSLS